MPPGSQTRWELAVWVIISLKQSLRLSSMPPKLLCIKCSLSHQFYTPILVCRGKHRIKKNGCSYTVTEEGWTVCSCRPSSYHWNLYPLKKSFFWEYFCRCTYLPRGTSMSSFLQRTFGWGSPCTWQRNSTVSSSRTTWLMGLRRKVGRSAEWFYVTF